MFSKSHIYSTSIGTFSELLQKLYYFSNVATIKIKSITILNNRASFFHMSKNFSTLNRSSFNSFSNFRQFFNRSGNFIFNNSFTTNGRRLTIIWNISIIGGSNSTNFSNTILFSNFLFFPPSTQFNHQPNIFINSYLNDIQSFTLFNIRRYHY